MIHTFPHVKLLTSGEPDPRSVDGLAWLLPGAPPVKVRYRLTGTGPLWVCATHGRTTEPTCAHTEALANRITERNQT